MTPVHFHEDAVARRWLAARTMRLPLVVLKFGSPLLTLAAVAVIVNHPNLAAQPLDVLYVIALPFAVPFLLAAIYPVVRWMPQEWTLDASGIRGRGRVSGQCPWAEVAAWSVKVREPLPTHVEVVFRRAPAWRHLRSSMLVSAAERERVDGWFRTASAVRERRP
jgi:hypothetical protein